MPVNLPSTNPPVTLEAKSNNFVGDMVFIDGKVTGSGADIPSFLQVHPNANGQWEQLMEILQYCGRTEITTPGQALSWYRAQTPVAFIDGIRKYLLEVLFPQLVTFINKVCTSTGTAPPPVTGFTNMIEGWEHILKTMTVTYENGLVKSITI